MSAAAASNGPPIAWRLPDRVELSAFRIVQEALTNVIRHAERAPAEVELRYEPDRLIVQVADEAPSFFALVDPRAALRRRRRLTRRRGDLRRDHVLVLRARRADPRIGRPESPWPATEHVVNDILTRLRLDRRGRPHH